jgi:hypothetical protein
MPNEESKNAANVTDGMSKAMTGQKMRTIDSLNEERQYYWD